MDRVFIPILEGHVNKQELHAAQQIRAEQIRKRDEEKRRQAEQHQRDQIAREQSERNARTLDSDQKSPATTFDH